MEILLYDISTRMKGFMMTHNTTTNIKVYLKSMSRMTDGMLRRVGGAFPKEDRLLVEEAVFQFLTCADFMSHVPEKAQNDLMFEFYEKEIKIIHDRWKNDTCRVSELPETRDLVGDLMAVYLTRFTASGRDRSFTQRMKMMM